MGVLLGPPLQVEAVAHQIRQQAGVLDHQPDLGGDRLRELLLVIEVEPFLARDQLQHSDDPSAGAQGRHQDAVEPGVHQVLAGCSIRIGPQIGQRHNLIALPHPSCQSLSRSQALRGRGAGPLPRIEALHELEPLVTVRIGVDEIDCPPLVPGHLGGAPQDLIELALELERRGHGRRHRAERFQLLIALAQGARRRFDIAMGARRGVARFVRSPGPLDLHGKLHRQDLRQQQPVG